MMCLVPPKEDPRLEPGPHQAPPPQDQLAVALDKV